MIHREHVPVTPSKRLSEEPHIENVESATIRFRRPPISEVVIATYFKPALELSTEHIGLYWKRIRSRFPEVRKLPPVGDLITDISDVFPMPRYWFTADDDASLIQIQKNAFVFNWRRRQDGMYPRYRSIKPDFDKYYALFSEFVRTEIPSAEPTIDLCELTYVNTIQQCRYWQGPQDTNKIIPSFSMLTLGGGRWSSDDFDCKFAFRTENENAMHLQVAARSGKTTQAPSIPILVFEIKATEQVGCIAKSEADDWFDRAHEMIMDCFLGMTDQHVQEEHWEREQHPS